MAKTNKTLLIDIETSPIIGYTWELYEANVLKVIEPVKVICCGWKWIGESDVTCVAVSDYDGYIKGGTIDDGPLINDAWKVLDEADIVVGHNADAFDIKRLNARFIANGLTAPSPYKTVDTLKVAKKYFKFDSNRLDYLGEYLEEGRKEKTGGFDLWLKCLAGDPEAWSHMKAYNIQDILLLEKIYLRLRPFVVGHPDVSDIGHNGHHCPSCGSSKIERRGFSRTLTGRKQRYQCNSCGSWSLGSFSRDRVVDEDDG